MEKSATTMDGNSDETIIKNSNIKEDTTFFDVKTYSNGVGRSIRYKRVIGTDTIQVTGTGNGVNEGKKALESIKEKRDE